MKRKEFFLMKKQVYNPFLPIYECVPDGEPHVFGDRVYLYGSHDKEGGETFCMLDYTTYSAPVTDLSDWRCEGTIYRADQDPAYPTDRKFMYAPDVVQGNDGRFYLYYCMSGRAGFGGYNGPISVAVSDSPAGPFRYLGFVHYPDGSPMLNYVCFDPGVINDDGTIRIYYGTWSDEALDKDFPNHEEAIQTVMQRYHKSRNEVLQTEGSVMGPCTVTVGDDMLTVTSEPRHIIPAYPIGTSFEEHPFFEASSIRKIGGKYYFIYSSWQNHELCYATSDLPDRDFVFGGTIVSNGDVGYHGRSEKDRLNMTGTTHGSIECINGQWYVFYHRLTHKSDYSRQACAEPITILPDGSIPQVEITSCGLNGKPLHGTGTYPAVIACNITNGHMPHGSNKIYTDSFPNATHCGEDRFIGEIQDGTMLGYKYFAFSGAKEIGVQYRGSCNGKFVVSDDMDGKNIVAEIPVAPADAWTESRAPLHISDGTHPLYLFYRGDGEAAVKELYLA